MAAILYVADGPKSIAFVLLVICDYISNLKSIGETRGTYSIHFKKFDGGHLDLSRWPEIIIVRPEGGITS